MRGGGVVVRPDRPQASSLWMGIYRIEIGPPQSEKKDEGTVQKDFLHIRSSHFKVTCDNHSNGEPLCDERGENEGRLVPLEGDTPDMRNDDAQRVHPLCIQSVDPSFFLQFQIIPRLHTHTHTHRKTQTHTDRTTVNDDDVQKERETKIERRQILRTDRHQEWTFPSGLAGHRTEVSVHGTGPHSGRHRHMHSLDG